MIQVLQIREYIDPSGVKQIARLPVPQKLNAVDIVELFDRMEDLVYKVPENERYNLHYSLAHWGDRTGNVFEHQDVIPFDLDHIDLDRIDEYVPVVCNVLNVDPKKVGVVYSGGGIHILIYTTQTITTKSYFEETRHHYKAICSDINNALYEHGLMAECDTSLWCSGKSLRLSYTENRKERGISQCVLKNSVLSPYDFDITSHSKLPVVEIDEQLNPKVLKKMSIDVKAVLACPFILNCQANVESVSEPAWYGMLSVLAWIPKVGKELCHKMSEAHPQYNEEATDKKIEQAMACSGPRTCSNITNLWDGCKSCEHNGEVTSPLNLRGPDFIKTEGTGFYTMNTDKNGVTKRGKPSYDDLVLKFKEDHTFKVLNDTIFAYTGKYWKRIEHRLYAEMYAEQHFDPTPDTKMCTEFKNKLLRHSEAMILPEFFDTQGLINFQNGWLDPVTGVLDKHDEDKGFAYVLPFDYNPKAECKVFNKFITEVSSEDKEIEQLLTEYCGYVATAADSRIDPKALIMVGDGANGKSVLAELLMAMMGESNYSATSLKDAVTKPEARSNMMGKLLNVSEEVPTNALVDSSVFKNLVTGGVIESRMLYKDVIRMRNTAKLIMTCNELPPTRDLSDGMRRRLLIIYFRAKFNRAKGNIDPFILDKMKPELAGIWNRCYRAFVKMKERGGFLDVASVLQDVDDFVTAGSLAIQWWHDQDKYEVGDAKYAEVQSFYQLFRADAEMDGIHPAKIPAAREFLKDIRNYLNLATSVRKIVGGQRVRVQWGIGLTE